MEFKPGWLKERVESAAADFDKWPDCLKRALRLETAEKPEEHRPSKSELIKLLACPFCGTTQVQLIPNYGNRLHDAAKCRDCKGTAKVSVWNRRNGPKDFPH